MAIGQVHYCGTDVISILTFLKDVKWVALMDDNTTSGLYMVALDHLCDVGASLFSEEELSQYHHTWQLVEGMKQQREDIHLHVDYKMMGVGGDDSWSGLTVLPPYWVPPRPVKYSLLLIPIAASQPSDSLLQVCRQAEPSPTLSPFHSA